MTDTVPGRTLQLFYAALMVDAAANFEHFGVEARVAEKKAREQALAAPGQLAQLGITGPRGLFETFSAIFGCAQWTVSEEPGGGAAAETRGCLACAIAKKRGSGRPCGLYCIGPFTALAAAMTPSRTLTVDETLWEGERCLFRLGPA
jgi:hypothetical protein